MYWNKTQFGWFEMNTVKNSWQKKSAEHLPAMTKDLGEVAKDVCEKSLNEAKAQLHPLLKNVAVERLDQRTDFLQALKNALERRIARTLAAWLPGVQTVFTYDETRMEDIENWDGSIRLLVKVPRLSNTVRALASRLDRALVRYFRQRGWERFCTRPSILEVQQVTPNELRHSIGYGALFCAVYNVPVRVWPQEDP
jgi:CHAD domain-containing protein